MKTSERSTEGEEDYKAQKEEGARWMAECLIEGNWKKRVIHALR